MGGYRKFLSFYSVIGATALSIASFIYIPRPESLLFLALFTPTAAYFWLRTGKKSHPTTEGSIAENTPPAKGSIKTLPLIVLVIIFTLFISNISVYLYSTLNKNYATGIKNNAANENINGIKTEIEKLSATDANPKIVDSLTDIKNDISYLKAVLDVKFNIPSATPSSQKNQGGVGTGNADFGGFVTINDTTQQSIYVHKEANFTSKNVGQLLVGKNYHYSRLQDSWYLVLLPDNTEGWVNNKLVKEVTTTP